MEFPSALKQGVLQRRYQRFLADVELPGGELITAHCPNTGAMTGCAQPGSRVWLSVSGSATRKYPHTWELVETAEGLACIHSARANRVVAEALRQQRIPELAGYDKLETEVRYGQGSRADLVLSSGGRRCLVEVKSVTWCDPAGLGLFPDAVSIRARKHLRELQAVAEAGQRAVIFFCAFHTGISSVSAAVAIDPAYGEALSLAQAAGVEAMAWGVRIAPRNGISLHRRLPVVAPAGAGLVARPGAAS